MTPEEKSVFDEYGTAYPCCGNCANIREACWKLMCKLNYEYREFGSLKCVYYKFKQNVPVLEELIEKRESLN